MSNLSSGYDYGNDYKRQSLQTRRADLIEEYKALGAQLRHTSNAAEQLHLKRQMDKLDRRIQALERELAVVPAPEEPIPPGWCLAHPYPMPSNFTGREAEQAALSDWLENEAGPPVLVLRALGGFGKSALCWHWLLAAAHLAGGGHSQAERHLAEALTRCRGINLVEFEADILLDLARLGAALGRAEEAARRAEEALAIALRCGYALQAADAHLVLARLARAAGDRAAARQHAQEARRWAACDGPPDYTYYVAYEEAGQLMEDIGGFAKSKNEV